MKDYRLTIKVRNNRILKAIEAVGGTPGNKWCDANGLDYGRTNDLINMTISPLSADGKLSHHAEKLCDVLGKLPDELWSNEQLYPLERNFGELEMDHEQVVALLPVEQRSYLPDFSSIEQAQQRTLLERALAELSAKERMVLRLRFEDDLTLEECAKRLDVTRERVREIEKRALRGMRRKCQMLADAVD